VPDVGRLSSITVPQIAREITVTKEPIKAILNVLVVRSLVITKMWETIYSLPDDRFPVKE